MKAIYILIFGCFLSTSCNRYYGFDLHLGKPKKISGPVIEKDIPLTGFEGVVVAMNADVVVIPADTYKIHASGAEEVINDLTTFVDDGNWIIDTEKPYQYDWKTQYRPKTEITIHMPVLNTARITGSGRLTIEDYFPETESFYVGVSGSGDLSARVHSAQISGKIAGSGNLELEGETEILDVKISGSGNLRARDLMTSICDMRIFGSGDAIVNVEKQLNAQTSGSGSIRYIGSPNINSKKSGSGSVSRIL